MFSSVFEYLTRLKDDPEETMKNGVEEMQVRGVGIEV